MRMLWTKHKLIKLLFLIGLGFSGGLVSPLAEARVGGGRSMGRTPSPMYRRPTAPPSYSQPAAPRYEPRPTPSPVQPMGQPPLAPAGGGFLRNAAGGLAGGFLGSMLFNSFNRGGGAYGGGYGGGGYGGGGGGGVGLLDLLIFAGIAFFVFRWWRNRQQALSSPADGPGNIVNFRAPEQDSRPLAAISAAPVITTDEASDIFFRIQGAWTRRDLTPVQDLLGPEMTEELSRDLSELKAQHRINRLENIAIRHVTIGEGWSEGGMDMVAVRFLANLLDYTVDETSNKVLEGSDSQPVKFEEDWQFGRPSGGGKWQLLGIQQVQ